MQFLYPYFLWALAVIAIPVIIHLFYFRRFKKVYFTNVRFLKSIKEETAARSKLRNLLVLLARVLALTCLVLAFALPFLHRDEARIGRKASSVFIDNSFSMEAKAADVILLEKAKAYAREVITSHNEDDLIQVLTHDFKGSHQRLVDREEALSLVEEIEITPSVKLLSDVQNRQKQLLNSSNTRYRNIYWISDFQKSIVDLSTLQDTTFQNYALPLQSVEESNVSIDSAWLSSPVARLNEPNTVFVRLTNRGNAPAENVRLSFFHQGQEKPVSVIDLEAGDTVTDTFNFSISTPGWQHIEIKLTDHPVTFDDHYFLSFEVQEELSAMVLSDTRPDAYMATALKSMDNMDMTFQSARQVDYSRLASQDMVILEGLTSLSTGLSNELSEYIRSGGNLLIFPSQNIVLEEYNNFLQKLNVHRLTDPRRAVREVSYINTSEFIFDDVFTRVNENIRLPSANWSFELDRSGRGEETLLRFRDGGSFISKFTVDKGRVYLSVSPIDKTYNSLANDAEIFIPMLYKMALSTSESYEMSHTIGADDLIQVQGDWDYEQKILEIKGAVNFIPGITRIGPNTLINVNEQIEEAGIYDLYAGDQLVQKIAFNYDRTESELSYYTSDEIKEKLGEEIRIIDSGNQTSLAQVLKESEEGQPLWKWLLIFTLLFLAAEQLLLRFWKI